jgi:hypothetical protein
MLLQVETALCGEIHVLGFFHSIEQKMEVELSVAIAYLILSVSQDRVSFSPTRFTISYNHQKIEKDNVLRVVNSMNEAAVAKGRKPYPTNLFEPGYIRKYDAPQPLDGSELTRTQMRECEEEFRVVYPFFFEFGYENDLKRYYNSEH